MDEQEDYKQITINKFELWLDLWNFEISDLKSLFEKIDRMDLKTENGIVLSDEWQKIGVPEDIFPDAARKAFIVMLLIEFDSHLISFCKLLKDANGCSLTMNDLKGSSIERFKTYISKVINIEPNYSPSEDEQIKGIIELRNCIVHENSTLTNDNNKRADAIKQLKKHVNGIDIGQGYFITLSFEACVECAEIVRSYMTKAYEVAIKKYPDYHEKI